MLHKLLFLIIIALLVHTALQGQEIVINEVMASNSTTLADENGDYEDWIELYNASGTTVNLEGFGLSDNYEDPFQWVFPSVEIQPGNFLLVWASGKDRTNPNSALHTNFRIASAGEEVLLTDPYGLLFDELPPIPIPTDISYGRQPDAGDNWYYFDEPTPGESNHTQGFSGITEAPEFSQTTGFFTDPFELNLSVTQPGASIHYTLNGSRPDENSQVYSGPIPITSLEGTPNHISMIPTNNDGNPGPPNYEGWQPPAGEVFKVNVVRAVAMADDQLPGPVITHSYLVDEDGVDRYSLPIFFLNTDEENFFDPDMGIYIPGYHNNMFQRGREWERPMHLAFFEKDGTHAFSGDMGVRIHGGTTRSRPRKSLRIYARNQYSDPWIQYQLFDDKPQQNFKRLILRNSGNDWGQAIFRDGFMQYLAKDLHVEIQYYRPAILFLNGEYWGIHNIRDRYDQHYIYSHYGLQEHEMTVLENNSVLAYGNPQGITHYNSMRSFVENNNMASATNYQYVQTLMDTESFIDAQITNIFIMNTDWPGNNVNFFRRLIDYTPDAPPGMDGRWRWHILDTDFGFGLDLHYVVGVNEGPAHNTLALATQAGSNSWPNYDWSTMLLRRLLHNNQFQNDFINRFADLMNTTFKEEKVTAIIDSIETLLHPEMEEHIHRWQRPDNLQQWVDNVQRMRNFGQDRPAYVRAHIQNEFDINGTYNIHLTVNDNQMGHIRLNTIEPSLEQGWQGIYFNGIPIELEAIPRPGYQFSHWSGTQQSNQKNWEITLSSDANFTAHFEESTDFPGDDLNPPAYKLTNGPYTFNYWSPLEPENSFPPHMLFLQSDQPDPELQTPMTQRYHILHDDYHSDDATLTGFPYQLTGRTRINGLEEEGISFINTGRDRDLGAAVLALDTRGLEDITVSWTAGTVIPNARKYAIRLQYKVTPWAGFTDVTGENGLPVEYIRSPVEGHQQSFSPVVLPEQVNNQEYVQLRWKYYYTGHQVEVDHGRRDMLRLDNIEVNALTLDAESSRAEMQRPGLMQNQPNPASTQTQISFSLPGHGHVEISLYDAWGRHLQKITSGDYPAGTHSLDVDVTHLEAGVYFYQMESGRFSQVKKIIVQ